MISQLGMIIAVTIPPGAQVFIDGTAITEQPNSTTPVIIHNVPAGTRIVTLRLRGYLDATINANVPKGGYKEVSVILKPTP